MSMLKSLDAKLEQQQKLFWIANNFTCFWTLNEDIAGNPLARLFPCDCFRSNKFFSLFFTWKKWTKIYLIFHTRRSTVPDANLNLIFIESLRSISRIQIGENDQDTVRNARIKPPTKND